MLPILQVRCTPLSHGSTFHPVPCCALTRSTVVHIVINGITSQLLQGAVVGDLFRAQAMAHVHGAIHGLLHPRNTRRILQGADKPKLGIVLESSMHLRSMRLFSFGAASDAHEE
jgi:hypothetical protein